MWLQLINGKPYDFHGNAKLELAPVDLARALSHINRFNGHTRKPYTVAQHCVVVSRYLDFCPLYAMHGLLHDAHEALVCDLPTPLKWALDFEPVRGSDKPAKAGDKWRDIERRAEHSIYATCGLALPGDSVQAAVKQADVVALLTEKRDLMEPGDRAWTHFSAVPHWRKITPWSPRRAAVEWQARYAALQHLLRTGPEYAHALIGKG